MKTIKKYWKCKGHGFLMLGDSKCHITQSRKSLKAWPEQWSCGQNSPKERWATGHPTPAPGSWQKQEIQNSRKDPFFYQIPGCNLAPSSQGTERGRRKAAAKQRPYWVQRGNKLHIQMYVLAFGSNSVSQNMKTFFFLEISPISQNPTVLFSKGWPINICMASVLFVFLLI